MMVDIRTCKIQMDFMKYESNLRNGLLSMEDFSSNLISLSQMLEGYCDSKSYEEKLSYLLYNLGDAIDEDIYLYWFDGGCTNDDQAQEIPNEFKLKLLEKFESDFNRIKSLIVNENTNVITTEQSINEWWKKMKERERQEFYEENGYYEDEVQ